MYQVDLHHSKHQGLSRPSHHDPAFSVGFPYQLLCRLPYQLVFWTRSLDFLSRVTTYRGRWKGGFGSLPASPGRRPVGDRFWLLIQTLTSANVCIRRWLEMKFIYLFYLFLSVFISFYLSLSLFISFCLFLYVFVCFISFYLFCLLLSFSSVFICFVRFCLFLSLLSVSIYFYLFLSIFIYLYLFLSVSSVFRCFYLFLSVSIIFFTYFHSFICFVCFYLFYLFSYVCICFFLFLSVSKGLSVFICLICQRLPKTTTDCHWLA